MTVVLAIEHKIGGLCRQRERRPENDNNTMKMLAIFILGIALFSAITSAQAGGARGYFRSSGTSQASTRYVYHNPYAAYPSVRVRGYTKSTGTFVLPHYRTPANWKVQDNLSYRGYGTIRGPRY